MSNLPHLPVDEDDFMIGNETHETISRNLMEMNKLEETSSTVEKSNCDQDVKNELSMDNHDKSCLLRPDEPECTNDGEKRGPIFNNLIADDVVTSDAQKRSLMIAGRSRGEKSEVNTNLGGEVNMNTTNNQTCETISRSSGTVGCNMEMSKNLTSRTMRLRDQIDGTDLSSVVEDFNSKCSVDVNIDLESFLRHEKYQAYSNEESVIFSINQAKTVIEGRPTLETSTTVKKNDSDCRISFGQSGAISSSLTHTVLVASDTQERSSMIEESGTDGTELAVDSDDEWSLEVNMNTESVLSEYESHYANDRQICETIDSNSTQIAANKSQKGISMVEESGTDAELTIDSDSEWSLEVNMDTESVLSECTELRHANNSQTCKTIYKNPSTSNTKMRNLLSIMMSSESKLRKSTEFSVVDDLNSEWSMDGNIDEDSFMSRYKLDCLNGSKNSDPVSSDRTKVIMTDPQKTSLMLEKKVNAGEKLATIETSNDEYSIDVNFDAESLLSGHILRCSDDEEKNTSKTTQTQQNLAGNNSTENELTDRTERQSVEIFDTPMTKKRKNSNSYKIVQQTSSTEQKNNCWHCKEFNGTERELGWHLREAFPQHKYMCLYCIDDDGKEIAFPDEESYRSHTLRHSQRDGNENRFVIFCPLCNGACETQEALDSHIQNLHSDGITSTTSNSSDEETLRFEETSTDDDDMDERSCFIVDQQEENSQPENNFKELQEETGNMTRRRNMFLKTKEAEDVNITEQVSKKTKEGHVINEDDGRSKISINTETKSATPIITLSQTQTKSVEQPGTILSITGCETTIEEMRHNLYLLSKTKSTIQPEQSNITPHKEILLIQDQNIVYSQNDLHESKKYEIYLDSKVGQQEQVSCSIDNYVDLKFTRNGNTHVCETHAKTFSASNTDVICHQKEFNINDSTCHYQTKQTNCCLKEPFECHHCRKHFLHKYSVRKHILITHMNEVNSACHLQTNKPTFQQRKLSSCHMYGSHFTKQCNLYNKRPFTCKVCNKSFTRKSHLIRHKKTIHNGERPFTCNECNKSFCLKYNLLAHKKAVHNGERPFTCKVCNKSFSLKCNLLVHKKAVHNGERPFTCEVCNKSFIWRSHLICHKKTVHNGERSFSCNECNKSFTQKSHLICHKKTVHNGERPFTCNECNKSLTQKSTLLRHKKAVHNGERPFTCKVCNKSFTRKSHLICHEKTVHNGERPFTCKFCNKSFTCRSQLICHEKTVHNGERPFTCNKCEKSFTQKSNLRSHIIRVCA